MKITNVNFVITTPPLKKYLRLVHKNISILALIVFFTISGCDFDKLSTNNEGVMSLIPETAIIGAYANDPKTFSSALAESSMLNKGLQNLLNFQGADLFHPDSLVTLGLNLEEVSISWHSVSGDALAPLVLIQAGNRPNQNQVKNTLLSVLNGQQTDLSNKLLNDIQIWTLSAGEVRISWILKDDLLAISTSELLIEDVVRSVNETKYRMFKDQILVAQSGIKLFLNGSRYNELANKIGKVTSEFPLKDEVLLLNVEVTEKRIAYSGEAFSAGQSNLSNELIFGQSFMPLEATKLAWRGTVTGEESNLLDDFYASLAFEIFDKQEKLFVLSVKDPQALQSALEEKAMSLLQPEDSTIYQEQYASELIGFIEDDHFNQYVEAEKNYLSNGAYYCLVEDVLLVSPSADMLRKSLAAHFDEMTFGQSVEKRAFLDELIQDSYYTSVLVFDQSDIKADDFKETYRPLVLDWINQLSYSVFQVNATANNYLVSGEVSYFENKGIEAVIDDSGNSLGANTFLDTLSHTGVHIVRNHNNNNFEILIQDQKNQIYQIDLQGAIKWKIDLGEKLVVDVVQVDYYNNRKLQYLLVTDSLIHIIDRNGNEIDGFPKTHGIENEINGFSLVDYDNTKRYRYLISAGRGELRLFDKEVNALEGWSPRALNTVLEYMPYHDRVAGKDFFIAAERSNRIHLLNRRGEEYSGFPVNLNQRFSGGHFFKKSPNMTTSELIVISDDGLLKRVNLLGKTISEKQFLKESNDDQYRLLPDVLGNGFLIFKANPNVIKAIDENDQLIFEIPAMPSDTEFYYYRLSGGKSVIMAWNKSEGSVSLYNMKGIKISNQIYSDEKPSLLYFSREGFYQLFTNLDNRVNIFRLSSTK